ncbi:MAG: MFS transporter [Cellulomonas sp. 73-145]|uniref:MFS transporter n=1 Tax=Cellulomonas sp. 73-145 TaxID=1895739 RepID=UPI00092671C4|nr:MFS transporter [Cellulomonas sp. 73-145]OJV56879.1 MAG: MFS transporter [Cellulomonas sp. 73-145]
MAGRTGDRRGWLTRNLVVLTLVSLFQDTASELLYPLLPVLVTGVLAAPPVVLGVIEGVAEGTAGLTRYVTGRWSDRAGRVRFIGAGYGLAAVGKVLVAAAGAWPMVLAGRTVDRLGKGVRSAPRDALIAASVPSENLGRAFGFHRAGDTLGAVVGPLLGLLALSVMGGNLHAALWWAVVPAALSAGLVVLVREHRAPAPAPAPARPAAASAAPSHPLPAAYWWVVGVLVVVGLVNFSDTLLLLRVSELGFGTTQVVLAYVLFNVVYALGSYPAGALTDRWPRAYVYAVGLLAFAVGYVGLALVGKGPVVFVLLAVYGLFPALTDGVGKAWISSLVPAEHRGRAQGAFQALSSGAVLVAGLWAGLLWDVGRGGGTVPLLVSGVGALVAVPVLAALRFRARPHP